MDPRLPLLALGLGFACYTDLTDGKIPNRLTGPLLLSGLIAQALLGDPLAGWIGALAAFAVHFGLFAVGVVKGGDAKLMIGVGALVGWREMLEATLWELILLVPVGLAVLALKGRLANLIHAAHYAAARAQGRASGEAPPTTPMIFAPVIALAVLLAHLTDWMPSPW